jgi:hypothetical protein
VASRTPRRRSAAAAAVQPGDETPRRDHRYDVSTSSAISASPSQGPQDQSRSQEPHGRGREVKLGSGMQIRARSAPAGDPRGEASPIRRTRRRSGQHGRSGRPREIRSSAPGKRRQALRNSATPGSSSLNTTGWGMGRVKQALSQRQRCPVRDLPARPGLPRSHGSRRVHQDEDVRKRWWPSASVGWRTRRTEAMSTRTTEQRADAR